MAGIIHFTSGKTLEINEMEYRNISPVLNAKGIKTKRLSTGHVIPMNSMTMEFIEHVPEELPGDNVMEEPKVVPGVAVEKYDWKTDGRELEDMKQAEPKVKTADDIMAEMTAKSDCKHEPEKMELYIQHTAKGIRYFPVCSFCGRRERYVAESKIMKGEYVGTPNEKWTDKDIANAKAWIED